MPIFTTNLADQQLFFARRLIENIDEKLVILS